MRHLTAPPLRAVHSSATKRKITANHTPAVAPLGAAGLRARCVAQTMHAVPMLLGRHQAVLLA